MKMPTSLKDISQHLPDASLLKVILSYAVENLRAYVLFISAFLVLTIREWYRWFTDAPPSPGFFTLVTLAILVFSFVKLKPRLDKVIHMTQGNDDAKVLIQFLSELPESGAKVLRDFPADKFKLDYIVLHVSGIYIIDTRFCNNPDAVKKVSLNGNKATEPAGKDSHEETTQQIKAAVNWLQAMIKENSGSKLNIMGVTVIPGWIAAADQTEVKSDTSEIGPKALVEFISNRKSNIPKDTVQMVATLLSRHLRSLEAESARIAAKAAPGPIAQRDK